MQEGSSCAYDVILHLTRAAPAQNLRSPQSVRDKYGLNIEPMMLNGPDTDGGRRLKWRQA